MTARLLLCRRDNQHEQVIKFETSDHAMAAIAHNERVQVYFPLGAGLMVRPLFEDVPSIGWKDATCEYLAHELRSFV